MVTAPYPPGSRQLISPPASVLMMAPANVLHGAVRLHGLTSSPTPETQVRVAAAAGVAQPMAIGTASTLIVAIALRIFMVNPFPLSCAFSSQQENAHTACRLVDRENAR